MTQWRTDPTRGPAGGSGWAGRGLLTLVPVLVLAGFGCLALRQDRRWVESEVRERAQVIARDTLDRCRRDLGADGEPSSTPGVSRPVAPSSPSLCRLRVSARGELLAPPPMARAEIPPPLDASSLGVQSARLWSRYGAARGTNAPVAEQVKALEAFLSDNPPAEFEALARFRLGGLWRPLDASRAAAQFQAVIERFPQAVGETSLPLWPLAGAGWVDALSEANPTQHLAWLGALNQWVSNAVARPGPLSQWVIEEAVQRERARFGRAEAAVRWAQQWANDERTRRVYQAARMALEAYASSTRLAPSGRVRPGEGGDRLPPERWPAMIYFQGPPLTAPPGGWTSESAGETWLAVGDAPAQDGSRGFVCRHESEVQALRQGWGQAEQGLPAYLSVFYVMGTRPWRRDQEVPPALPFAGGVASVGDPQRKPGLVLATAEWPPEGGPAALTVGVVLVDSVALYARQRQRLWWFGALIAAAIVTAVVGFVSTRAAFRRQQRLYQMQSDFVSSVTHELRAPIGAVRLLAENLSRGKVTEAGEQRRFLDYIVQECGRLSSMIENVLNLARIEQGRQAYQFEPADVVRLVDETARVLAPTAAEARVELRIEIDRNRFSSTEDPVVLDGRAIQQVLLNLIDNALKHSPPRTVVRVGLEWIGAEEERRGGTGPTPSGPPAAADGVGVTGPGRPRGVRLWVADEGPGIPAEEQAKIFERFYRRGTELRRETPGVGIGLSIVRHIVEAHRGAIRLRSAVGQGSTFSIELPLDPRAPAPDEPRTGPGANVVV